MTQSRHYKGSNTRNPLVDLGLCKQKILKFSLERLNFRKSEKRIKGGRLFQHSRLADKKPEKAVAYLNLMTTIRIAILLLPSAPLSVVREWFWFLSSVRCSLAQIRKRRVTNRPSKMFLTLWQFGKSKSAQTR